MGFKSDVRVKLEDIMSKQSSHTTELAVYNQSLKEHMRRTSIAEDSIKNLDVRVIPIEHHVLFISRSTKVLVTLISIATAVIGVFHFTR